MKLVCPACGAAASAEIFVNDATARQALKLAAEMPADVGKRALGYVGMFRNPDKESRGLRWDKALRLLHEINLLIQQSEIQLRGKASRKCTPGIWAQAMERMIERPPSRLPLTSHGYLTAIAWEIANEADKAADARRIAAVSIHAPRAGRDYCNGIY